RTKLKKSLIAASQGSEANLEATGGTHAPAGPAPGPGSSPSAPAQSHRAPHWSHARWFSTASPGRLYELQAGPFSIPSHPPGSGPDGTSRPCSAVPAFRTRNPHSPQSDPRAARCASTSHLPTDLRSWHAGPGFRWNARDSPDYGGNATDGSRLLPRNIQREMHPATEPQSCRCGFHLRNNPGDGAPVPGARSAG